MLHPERANIQWPPGFNSSKISNYFYSKMPTHLVEGLKRTALSRISRLAGKLSLTGINPVLFSWNKSRSIHILPPEILFYCILQCDPQSDDRDADTRFMIQLTHVCKYWYQCISIGTAKWNRITNQNRALTDISLKRSNKTPLDVWLNMEKDSPWFSDLIRDHIHIKQIEFLRITLTTFEDCATILPGFPGSMSKLHSLEISLSLLRTVSPPLDGENIAFPQTLRSLSLAFIPLYQPFCNIKTLIKFTFRDDQFSLPLDTLLIFLEENESLEHVELDIDFINTPSSIRPVPDTTKLQHLSVQCKQEAHVWTLLPYLPIQHGGNLEITSCDRARPGLANILLVVCKMYSRNLSESTHVHSNQGSIKFSGPGGTFKLTSPSESNQDFTRSDLCCFFSNIKNAHFTLVEGSMLHNPSLFPALEVLTIKDYLKHKSGTILDVVPSPMSSPLLKTLTFHFFDLPEGFMKQLTIFASNCSKNPSTKYQHITIICWHKRLQLDGSEISELEKHVGKVEVKDWTLEF